MLTYQLEPEQQTSKKFEVKYKLFIYENTFEIAVYELAAVLSRVRWVKGTLLIYCVSDRTSFKNN